MVEIRNYPFRSIEVEVPVTSQEVGAVMMAMIDVDDSVDEAEFNRWYFDEHVPSRLACPGFIAARRYRLHADASLRGVPAGGATTTGRRYLAIYDLRGPEALETQEYRSLDERMTAADWTMINAMQGLIRLVYTPITRADFAD
jgi:hypothetical protein